MHRRANSINKQRDSYELTSCQWLPRLPGLDCRLVRTACSRRRRSFAHKQQAIQQADEAHWLKVDRRLKRVTRADWRAVACGLWRPTSRPAAGSAWGLEQLETGPRQLCRPACQAFGTLIRTHLLVGGVCSNEHACSPFRSGVCVRCGSACERPTTHTAGRTCSPLSACVLMGVRLSHCCAHTSARPACALARLRLDTPDSRRRRAGAPPVVAVCFYGRILCVRACVRGGAQLGRAHRERPAACGARARTPAGGAGQLRRPAALCTQTVRGAHRRARRTSAGAPALCTRVGARAWTKHDALQLAARRSQSWCRDEASGARQTRPTQFPGNCARRARAVQ